MVNIHRPALKHIQRKLRLNITIYVKFMNYASENRHYIYTSRYRLLKI
jgi:hypothetical protein